MSENVNMLDRIKKLTNSEEKKRLLSNFFSLSILQAANYVLPLITLPYLVRVLGPEKYGLIVFAQAFIQYFNILTDYGFNLSATREISIYRDDLQKVSEIFSSVMVIKFGLLVLSLVIMSVLVFSCWKFRQDWLVYYLTFGTVIGQVLFPVWFFQGMERMKYITYLNLTAKLIFTVAIFIFISDKLDYWKVPLFNSSGYIIAGIISLLLVYKNFNTTFKFNRYELIKKYFKDSSQFFLSRVSVSVYTSSNIFVLGLFTTHEMVGYYSMAEKLYQAVQYLYSPVVQTLYPYITKSKNIQLFKKIFKAAVLINIICVFVIFLLDKNIFRLLFADKTSLESMRILRVFLVTLIVIVPSIMLGYPYLAAMGYPAYANKSVIYGSLIHFTGLFVLILINAIKPINVALMVLITESSVLLLRCYWAKSKVLL